MRHSL